MMKWDDRKGKYIKDVIDKQSTPLKRIKIIRWLYFDGRKLYWDIPEPKFEGELTKEWLKIYGDSWGYRRYLRYVKHYNMQEYLNKILSALPYIPLTGLILGVII